MPTYRYSKKIKYTQGTKNTIINALSQLNYSPCKGKVSNTIKFVLAIIESDTDLFSLDVC